jgi:hypothetical protein
MKYVRNIWLQYNSNLNLLVTSPYFRGYFILFVKHFTLKTSIFEEQYWTLQGVNSFCYDKVRNICYLVNSTKNDWNFGANRKRTIICLLLLYNIYKLPRLTFTGCSVAQSGCGMAQLGCCVTKLGHSVAQKGAAWLSEGASWLSYVAAWFSEGAAWLS